MSAVIFEDRGVRKGGGGGPKLTTVNSVAVVGGGGPRLPETRSQHNFSLSSRNLLSAC